MIISNRVFRVFFLFAIGIFGYVSSSTGQEKQPEIILMGNPADTPTNEVNLLPTGYSWTTEKNIIIDTSSSDDQRALFVLQEGITDMNKIVEWARRNGKTEIYFFTTPIYPPDQIAYLSIKSDIEEVMNNIYANLNWEENIIDFLFPKAFANNVPDPNCTSTKFHPAGSCDTRIVGGSAGGQPAPYIKVCYMFGSYDCYREPMTTHLVNNLAGYDQHSSGGPTSFVECIKAHKGSNYIKSPVNFTVKLYKTGTAPGLIQDCGTSGVFCAPGAPFPSAYCPNPSFGLTCNEPKPQPLFSADNKYIVLFDAVRNHWAGARHEMAHQYGYGHCHMEKNLDQTNHCIQAFTEPPGSSCNVNSPTSLPPNHIYF